MTKDQRDQSKTVIINEIYSGATRQSRTALNLSGATLVIYSWFGAFDNVETNAFKYVPGNFSVEYAWFGWIASAAVAYFWISFFLSALKDKRWFDEPALLVKVSAVADVLQSKIDEFAHQLGDIQNRTKMIIDEHKENAKHIDRTQIKTAFETQHDSQVRAALDGCLKLLYFIDNDEAERATVANFKNDNDRRISNLHASMSELKNQIAKTKSRTEGILEIKDNWIDFIVPLAFGGTAIVSFLLREIFLKGCPIIHAILQ